MLCCNLLVCECHTRGDDTSEIRHPRVRAGRSERLGRRRLPRRVACPGEPGGGRSCCRPRRNATHASARSCCRGPSATTSRSGASIPGSVLAGGPSTATGSSSRHCWCVGCSRTECRPRGLRRSSPGRVSKKPSGCCLAAWSSWCGRWEPKRLTPSPRRRHSTRRGDGAGRCWPRGSSCTCGTTCRV